MCAAVTQEIYSLLPEELFIERRDIFGFVFLFKWDAAIRSAGVPLDSIETLREVAVRQPIYFAKQVVKDACATQAIVNALLNIDAMVDVGDELRAFKAATESLPSDVRGIAVEQSALLQRVHNSFSPPHFVEVPPERGKEAHEAFHFVAFVPYADGRVVVELDGLAEEPLVHVSTPEDAPNSGDWIEGALACIRRRVERYAGCLQFTLLAFVRDHRDAWQQEIDALDAIEEPAAEVTERISLLRQQLAEENALMHEFYVSFYLGGRVIHYS